MGATALEGFPLPIFVGGLSTACDLYFEYIQTYGFWEYITYNMSNNNNKMNIFGTGGRWILRVRIYFQFLIRGLSKSGSLYFDGGLFIDCGLYLYYTQMHGYFG